MSDTKTHQAKSANYALEIIGKQDEYGLCENAYRFQASIVSLNGQSDLSVIHGLLISREAPGDLCVRIGHASDAAVPCKPIEIYQGPTASVMIDRGVDVSMQVDCERILFLHHPVVIDADDEREPGFRVLSALKRHFGSELLDVVIDLGTTEDSKEFNDYFFPHPDILDLEFQGLRFLRGRWNSNVQEHRSDTYTFGVLYD